MVYVVIDTNVLVSALLSKVADSCTVIIRNHLLDGTITPVYNHEIFKEYSDVLHRPKLNLPTPQVDAILEAIASRGVILGRTRTNEMFPDPKDVVFYEVALTQEGSYLVTGNIKHFPKTPIVITPAELIKIIETVSPAD